MKTNFDSANGIWAVSWPGKIARHDVVFQAPPMDPMQHGMPLGNGNLGALIWTETSKIVIALNRCDLFEQQDMEEEFLGDEEGRRAFLRHGCRIEIDFGEPLFETLYVKHFTGRLSLSDAAVYMDLESAFGTLSLKAFVPYSQDLLSLEADFTLREDTPVTVTLLRYGTGAFSRWYTGTRNNVGEGLAGTATQALGNRLFLTQDLNEARFACGLDAGSDTELRFAGQHRISAAVGGTKLRLNATVTPPCPKENDIPLACQTLDLAGEPDLYESHCAAWKRFWETSYLESDDPYLDSLWHLAMYYSCAGQRGTYPGRFINGLWSWSHDIQPWGYYFHWNQQTLYWGLNAAGHHELVDSYLNMRFRGLPEACRCAQQKLGKPGAFVSDITDPYGFNRIGGIDVDANHTPVMEIALDFWRQYTYTLDRTFLMEQAIPYMEEAAKFLESCLTLEADGCYHIPRGSAYEGWTIFRDVCTDLACGKALLTALVKAYGEAGIRGEAVDRWTYVRDRIFDIPLVETDAGTLDQDGDQLRLKVGQYAGMTVQTTKELAIGIPEGTTDYVPQYAANPAPTEFPWRYSLQTVRELMHQENLREDHLESVLKITGTHPQANTCAVFPAGIIGLKDKGSERFHAAVLTALKSRDEQDTTSGWDPLPIVLCRLGLAEAAEKYLDEYPSSWQYYNNGFGHYGWTCWAYPDSIAPYRMYPITNTVTGEHLWRRPWSFRHMGLEPLGVFSALMNERLLQSTDGIIRVAPAISNRRSARFTLHAENRFLVSAEIQNGTPMWIHIRNLADRICRLENPWDEAWANGIRYTETTLELRIPRDGSILITPAPDMVLSCEPENPQPNDSCRMRPDLVAMLGLPKME